MKFDGDPREWYFVLVEEWLMPLESGRSVFDVTYDTLEEALDAAREYLEGEWENFFDGTGAKPTRPEKYGDLMYIITPGEGQDDGWYDCIKIVPMTYGVMPIIGFSPDNPLEKGNHMKTFEIGVKVACPDNVADQMKKALKETALADAIVEHLANEVNTEHVAVELGTKVSCPDEDDSEA